MKVMSIFGTRPEMIKLWPVLKKLDDLNFQHIMVHTGQNFTPELKDFFFRDLELREPDYYLGINTSGYAAEVADVIVKTDALFEKEQPDALLILGDTFSGLCVLPATQRGIKIFHMEAGLRAYDKRMPEQRNRMLIDKLSDFNLVYHPHHRENLLRDGLHPSRIIITGNPTFETMRHFLPQIKNSDILTRLKVTPKNYILLTAHRSENVDTADNLQAIMTAMAKIIATQDCDIIYPMHPRTKNKLAQFNIAVPARLHAMAPLGFYDFNRLFMEARCVVSDSGTAPEEAFFYKVPCVSIRMTTERFETLEGGAHIVAGLDADNIAAAVETIITQPWGGRYDLNEDGFAPSNVVINTMRSQITNFF